MAEAQMGREQKMLKGAIRTAAVIAFAGVIAVTAGPARGDRFVQFDLDGATLDYFVYDGDTTIEDSGFAPDYFAVYYMVPSGDDAAVLDSVNFDVSDALFEFLMELTISGSDEDWSAIGTMTFSADDGTNTATQATYFDADFTSTSITLGDGELRITGYLDPTSGSSILVGGASSWVLPGDGDFAPPEADEDGVADQITVLGGDAYAEGELTVLHFNVSADIDTLETLFGSDRSLSKGDVDGTIVPVPGALALGLIGLGLMGWRMRRYA